MIRVLDRDDSAPGKIELSDPDFYKGRYWESLTLVEAMRLKNELQVRIHQVQAYEMADHGREA